MTILIGVLMAMAGILSMVGGIMLLVAAFRQSPMWGLAVLFIPFAGLVFLFQYWDAARKPFLIQLAALVIGGAGFGLGMTHGVSAMQRLALEMREDGMGGTNAESLLADMAAAMNTMGSTDASGADTGSGEVRGPRDLVGLSLDDVRALYGRPSGQMAARGRTSLLYAGFTVFSEDSRTVDFVQVEPGAENLEPTGDADIVRKATTDESAASESATIIRRGGARINMKDVIKPGRVTVVEFFADWHGPSRQMAPALDRLARHDPAVVLCRIDIASWESPVCTQYGIRSMPTIRVYDGLGHMIGEPASSLAAVRANVARARE